MFTSSFILFIDIASFFILQQYVAVFVELSIGNPTNFPLFGIFLALNHCLVNIIEFI